MTTTTTTTRPRKRGPQVNITLSPAELELFSSQQQAYRLPGELEPSSEPLGRTIKRLALERLGAVQA